MYLWMAASGSWVCPVWRKTARGETVASSLSWSRCGEGAAWWKAAEHRGYWKTRRLPAESRILRTAAAPAWALGRSCWRIPAPCSWRRGPSGSSGASQRRSTDGKCWCSPRRRGLAGSTQKSGRSTGGGGSSQSRSPRPGGSEVIPQNY